MAGIKTWKFRLWVLAGFGIVGILFSGYVLCNGSNCALQKATPASFRNNYDAYFAGTYIRNTFSREVLNKDYDVNIEKQDVIVFLHIQKTGGTTFGKHLVEHLAVNPRCNCVQNDQLEKKHCDCLTANKEVWLFSRYSTGWKCGLHADWTELKACVDDYFQTTYGPKKRRYFYVTLLRDPVKRFLSEWLHVHRGATWKTASLKCNGQEASVKDVPFCFTGKDWKGVTLKEFMACKHNLAINRQTRMLANLSKVNCYNSTGMTEDERNSILLQSAKDNLVEMAFFGLSEFQNYTQFLFEHTLNLHFVQDFMQHESTHTSRQPFSAEDLSQVAQLNHLDIELYQFAKDLFLQRVREAYIEENASLPASLLHELDNRVKYGTHGKANSNQQQSEGTESAVKQQNGEKSKAIPETNNRDGLGSDQRGAAQGDSDSLEDEEEDER